MSRLDRCLVVVQPILRGGLKASGDVRRHRTGLRAGASRRDGPVFGVVALLPTRLRGDWSLPPMLFAAQFTDDQIAVFGCAIVFGGCLIMMLISQKIGDRVRGRHPRSSPKVVPFPASQPESTRDRRAA